MNLSRKWLTEFVDVGEMSDRDFAEAMTLSGSKVEGTTDLGAEIRNVVVGKILSMERHPDSDHMWICQIDVGEAEPIQIVTGAWNVHEGDLLPVAKHNSLLPGGKKITKGKLRGVPSAGMLCSLGELKLDEHNFPYAVITPAAILGDYKALNPEKPSISPDIAAGDKIYGPVIAAKVVSCAKKEYGVFTCELCTGAGHVTVDTPCCNLHAGDLIAYNTKSESICTLEDLHAQQAEFPHCLTDGIFILNEPDLTPGEDIRPVIGKVDHVVEFEITPNRSDCLSMIGLAREAAVTFQKPLKLHKPEVKGGAGSIAGLVDVEVENPELCLRYTARMVRNVKIGPSPKWMRERISAMGMRPINNLVDITNYVMMEYGQPMHAFDFSYVKGGKIVVRTAREGETLTTLDGGERALTPSMLCICDEEKPIGLAGVMGGANSEIIGNTDMVLFESANFNGTSIRRTAAALNMRTDSSARYEKGLDPMMTYDAINRACELVELLGCGEVMDGVIDVISCDTNPLEITLDAKRVNAILGTDIAENTMRKILTDLGFVLDGEKITVPSWRRDISPVYYHNDVAEEVARFYGFNNIPSTLMEHASTTQGGYTKRQQSERLMGSLCRMAGFDEVITYSFFSPSNFDKILLPADSPLRDTIRILNPLGEDTSAMRTTTLPSMLEVLARNYNYRNKNVRLYELGRTYFKRPGEKLADEPIVLTLGAYGDDMDFYTLKGVVQAILEAFRLEDVRYEADRSNPSYHPGRCAKILSGETVIGTLGQVHPTVAGNFDADTELYTAELSVDAICACQGDTPLYVPLPRFPAVTRDLALVCDEALTVGELEDVICTAGGKALANISLFDIYRGPGIPAGKKSAAFNLEFRAPDRTLTVSEVDALVEKILSALSAKGVSLR
ncbi:MAG: phenylalanine--tRNA ligase subunit beta [Ruminococcaceae bacterium]|nr:phenylalanine--tRNA ligase subunit beta [Oscillospiraceae bacterium]